MDKKTAIAALESSLSGQSLLPPLTLAQMQALVAAFVQAHPAAAVWHEHLLIAVSNLIWAPVVAAVPVEKQLLLLPQCLRLQPGCPAHFDDIGLVCAGCGRCPIAGLQHFADARGMLAVVAEGSGVVARLLGEQEIQAVIGIGCLSSLKKAFPKTCERAIPSLAIPLDGDGCCNTAFDVAELHRLLQMPARRPRLDVPGIRAALQRRFSREWLDSVLGPAASQSEEIARQYLLGGGKRYRPLLVAAAYAAWTGGAEVPDFVAQAALASECFHKASLIHDDLEDGDASRDGVAALHVCYSSALAINAGDLLIGEGYRLLAGLPAPAEAMNRQLVQVAAAAHRRLCLGQGREFESAVPSRPAELLEIFAAKTGTAFAAALAFAAICAGVYEANREFIHQFGDAFGIAYQLRDDLNDGDQHSPFSILSHCPAGAAETLLQEYRGRLDELLAGVGQPALKLFLAQVCGRLAAPDTD